MALIAADAYDQADEAMDLGELMHHWSEREKAVFGGTSLVPEAYSFSIRPIPIEERVRAVQVLRMMAAQHDSQTELQAALTILDALRLATRAPRPVKGRFATPALLGAAARLVRKCGLGPCVELGAFSNECICAELQYLGEEVGEPSEITRAELDIVAALDGRVWLASPAEWANAVLVRLVALAGPEALERVLPSTLSWACILTERVAATPGLPPRALALGALALSLTGTGILRSDEIRPPSLSAFAWQESLLAKAEQSKVTKAKLRLSAGQLAWAACCKEGELRHCAFAAVCALQLSLSEDVHPQIAAFGAQ